jgi:hypothetical protein
MPVPSEVRKSTETWERKVGDIAWSPLVPLTVKEEAERHELVLCPRWERRREPHSWIAG